jgi:hypothetical protein
MRVPPLDLPPLEELMGETPSGVPDETVLLQLLRRLETLEGRLWQMRETTPLSSPVPAGFVLPEDPAGTALRFEEV